ncbi:hypothetical protein N9N28_11400 [Rubripirellula amarantea]|nr:hypothetical protein [Rubripirellula amarantea]
MGYRKHNIITMRRLQGALDDVQGELDRIGVFDERLANVEVYLTWFGTAFGWHFYGSTGHIEIPAISTCRLSERMFGARRTTLRDILRHEYAHAVADQNRGLIRSKPFRMAFGSGHNDEVAANYCPTEHVTAYAATDACEDFAEVFMFFLKHKGKIPKRFHTPAIMAKWSFVEALCQQIEMGNRRWPAS